MVLKPLGFNRTLRMSALLMIFLLFFFLSACIPVLPPLQQEPVPQEEIQDILQGSVETSVAKNESVPALQETPKSSQLRIADQNFNTTVMQWLEGGDVEDRFVEVARQYAGIAKKNPKSVKGAYSAEQVAFIQSAYLRDFGGALQVYEKTLELHKGFIDEAKIRRQIQSFTDMDSADSFYISNQNRTAHLKGAVQRYQSIYERYRNESSIVIPPMALFTAAKITRVDLDDAITANVMFTTFIERYDAPEFSYLAPELEYAYTALEQAGLSAAQ